MRLNIIVASVFAFVFSCVNLHGEEFQAQSDKLFNSPVITKELQGGKEVISKKTILEANPAYDYCLKAALLEQGNQPDYSEIVGLYTKAIGADPKFVNAYLGRGIAYINKKDYGQAIMDLNKVISIDKNKYEAYYALGSAYLFMEKYQESRSAFNKVIAINPELSNAYNQRAYTYIMQGEYKQANKDLDYVIQHDPLNPIPFYYKGIINSNLKQYGAAIFNLTKAIEHGFKEFESYGARGCAYFENKDYDAAIEDCSEAIKMDPNDFRPYYYRGCSFGNKGEHDKAIVDLNEALRLASDNCQVIFDRGICYERMAKYELALNDIEKAIALKYPDMQTAYNERGVIYKAMGQVDKALNDFDKAIALNPKYVEANLNKTFIYADQKKYSQAFEVTNKIMSLCPQDPRPLFFRGNIYRIMGIEKKAIEDFDAAIALDPGCEEAYLGRALTYHAMRDYDKAIQDYEAVKDLNPKNDIAINNLKQINSWFDEKKQEKARGDNFRKMPKYYDMVAKIIEDKYVNEKGERIVLDKSNKPNIDSLMSQVDSFNELLEVDDDSGTAKVGVGINTIVKDGDITIIIPEPGTSAEKAGILPEDKIIVIDGKNVVGCTNKEVLRLLSGPEGSVVKVKVNRNNGITKEFEIRRESVKLPSTVSYFTMYAIGYIHITEFNRAALRDIKKKLKEYSDNDICGLILDLRNNSGGVLGAAVEVSELLLKKQALVASFKGIKDLSPFNWRASKDGYTEFPIVILVNKGTAAGAELCAAALRENNRALIVGEKTSGVGCVQEDYSVSPSFFIRITTGYFFTPKGNLLHNRGIEPDLAVRSDNTELINAEKAFNFEGLKKDYNDEQLTKAYDILFKCQSNKGSNGDYYKCLKSAAGIQ